MKAQGMTRSGEQYKRCKYVRIYLNKLTTWLSMPWECYANVNYSEALSIHNNSTGRLNVTNRTSSSTEFGLLDLNMTEENLYFPSCKSDLLYFWQK